MDLGLLTKNKVTWPANVNLSAKGRKTKLNWLSTVSSFYFHCWPDIIQTTAQMICHEKTCVMRLLGTRRSIGESSHTSLPQDSQDLVCLVCTMIWQSAFCASPSRDISEKKIPPAQPACMWTHSLTHPSCCFFSRVVCAYCVALKLDFIAGNGILNSPHTANRKATTSEPWNPWPCTMQHASRTSIWYVRLKRKCRNEKHNTRCNALLYSDG